MSFTDDYRRASKVLHDLNQATSKITLDAKQKIAAKSLKEQLAEHMRQLREDQSDIEFAFEADRSPKNTKGWE